MENNLIDIKPYAKPKKGGTGNSHITYNITGADIGSDLSLRSLTANRILAEYIEANNFKGGAANFVYLVASDGSISTLRGDNLTYNSGRIDDFQSNNITTQKINVDDTATINNIYNNYLNTKEIVTDFLTVNKGAHFFEVVIDKIKSVGGTIINTATSCILDYVEPYYGDGVSAPMTGYKCYWKQTDDDERYVSNDWKVGDQAISQNCNLVAGVNHNTSNHYYWRVVSEVGNTTKYVNFDTGQVSDGVLVDGEYVAPDYKITFNDDFLYDNLQQGDYHITIDEWTTNNTPDSWNNNTLTVKDTLHGLNLFPKEIVDINTGDPDTNVTRMAWMSKGMFSFSTTKMTKLNVLFLFDDDTVEYHPIESIIAEMESHQGEADYANLNIKDGATDWYYFEIKAVTNAVVKQILITSDVVEVFHACHWIVLSDRKGEVDVPEVHDDLDPDDPRYNDDLFGDDVDGWDGVPAKGDNIAQLGFRYGQNPSQDDISRASAIIIAAYKTPDSGGIINGRTIMPVYPPSYAQYQNITDFQLFTHRGTYFDASGAYIKGNIVAGSNIDQSVVGFEAWSIISNVEYILDDGNGGPNPTQATITINYNNGSTWTTYNTLPTGKKLYVNEVNSGISSGNTMTISFNTLTDYVISLRDTTGNTIYGQLTIEYFDIHAHDGQNGTNGEYDQWAYTNRVNNPGYPNENRDNNTSSTAAYPPTGGSGASAFSWSKNPTTPSGNQNSWMITRHVSFDSSNDPIYGGWSYPIRLNGEDGQDGTDGTYSEYIYSRTNGSTPPLIQYGQTGTTWATLFNNQVYGTTNAEQTGFISYWTGIENGVNQTEGIYRAQNHPDFLPVSYTNAYSMYTDWHDHPQGVDSTNTHEWVSTREYDGVTETWGEFSTPVIWSKWGENGQDGDGIKYIFTMTSGGALNAPVFSPNGWNDVWSNRFDSNNGTTNNRHMWYDDAFSPTDTVTIDQDGNTWSNSDVLCSISKTYNVVNGVTWWTDWSTPKTWAMYVHDGQDGNPGATGPQGPTGPQGNDGESWTLEPIQELFQVKLTVNQIGDIAYNNIEGHVPTKLYYAINHTVGATGTYLTTNELKSYSLKLESSNTSGSKTKTISGANNYTNPDSGVTTVTKNGYSFPCIYYDDSNWLSYIGAPTIAGGSDIYKMYKAGATGISYIPLQMNVQLVKTSDSSKPLSERNISLSFEPDHIFSVTDSALNSVYQGLSGSTGAWSTAGFSQIHQDWENINLAVGNIEDDIDGLEANVAQLDIRADQITSTVESISNARDNLLEKTTFDSVNETATNSAATAGISYWWQQPSSSSIANPLSNSTEKYAGSNCLQFNVDYGSSANGSLYQRVPMEYIDNNKYTFSIYAKNTTGRTARIGLLAFNSDIVDYTNMTGSASPHDDGITYVQAPTTDSNYKYVQWAFTDTEWHRLFITCANITEESTLTIDGEAIDVARFGMRAWSNASPNGNRYLITMPKLEKGSTPSLWVPGTVDNKALKSEIAQTATTVSITALNTIINGDLDLHGTFTSDDQENMNKCVIDSENGGIQIYGPSSINDATGKPPSGATYKQYMDLTWTQDENGHRYGLIALNTRNTNDHQGVHAIQLDDTGFKMYSTEKNLYFDCDTINYAEYISGGETTKSSHVDWLDITARLTDYRIVNSTDYGTSLWRINEVNDVYIFDNSVTSINWNNHSSFEIGSGTAGNDGGETADWRKDNRHLYDGRTITIKPVNGLKIHNEDGYIITKGTAWTGGYGTPTTGSQTITFNGNNSASTHDYYPMKLIRHDGYWIEI